MADIIEGCDDAVAAGMGCKAGRGAKPWRQELLQNNE